LLCELKQIKQSSMKGLLLLSLLTICKISCNENVDVVYPVRLHPHRSRRDLSTVLEDKKHEDSLSVQLNSMFHDDGIVLDLTRNDETHPESLLLRTYDEEGNAKHDHVKPENCHYTGTVRGRKDSFASISTCSGGFVGTVEDGQHMFDIEPQDDQGAHRFSKADDNLKDILFRKEAPNHVEVEDDPPAVQVYPPGEMLTDTRPIAKEVRPYGVINVEPQYQKYLTTNDTRWVEMFISVGHAMWNIYKNTDQILERVLNSIGSVDKGYQAINVRLVVVALEIQNSGDTFPRSPFGVIDLKAFKMHYWKLKWEEPLKSVSIDTGMLLSYQGMPGIAGMAYSGTICRTNNGRPVNGIHPPSVSADSVSISKWLPDRIAGSTVVIGHEFGHIMNFPDIVGEKVERCTCLTRRGCFMGGPHKSVRPGFWDCDMERFQAKSYHCLSNRPKNPLSSECGNGIKEKGEECDCGTPETCKRTDPCCEPYSCKLKPEMQCSLTDHCCTQQCLFEKPGTKCRAKTSDCDIPEYCTGESSTCPDDEFVMDGTSCGTGEDSYCYSGGCIETADQQCSKLWREHHKLECQFRSGKWWGSRVTMRLGAIGREACAEACLVKDPGTTRGDINAAGYRGKGWYGEYCFCLKDIDGIRTDPSGRFETCVFERPGTTASEHCWQLNKRRDGYGTCSDTSYTPCADDDVKCGQLQCRTSREVSTENIQFGTDYKDVDVNGTKCNAIKLNVGHSGQLKQDALGVGMVADGTKCGDGKMCMAQRCISVRDHHIDNCPTSADGVVCHGRGVCSHMGKCMCDPGYDPDTDCLSETAPVDGGWGEWRWSECTKQCGGGTRRRYRFCDNPTPIYGGLECQGGDRVVEEPCNVEPCVEGKTCRDIKIRTEAEGRQVHDGVYQIKMEDLSLHVYCDMTRDGGGWTLLVSSHTNTWTADNVRLRNVDKPHLYQDYSILQYANKLKDTRVEDSAFQYRLEAHNFGTWGGIWQAPNSYDLSSTNPGQTNVQLMKKFSDWEYHRNGLGKRLPYVNGPRITTSTNRNRWGSVTDNQACCHPSKWISGKLKMQYPEHVWYWLRE